MTITTQQLHLSQVAQVQSLIHPNAQPALEAEEVYLFSANCDGQLCGALVASLEDGDAILYSLFVAPDYRRRGVGTALLSALRQGLEGEELDELYTQWILPQEGCEGLEGFLQCHGFDCDREEAPIYRIYSGDLAKSPFLRGAFSTKFRPDANIIPVSRWTQAMWEELGQDSTIDPLLRPEPFRGEMWEEASVGYRYGGRIVAYLLLKEAAEGEIVLLPGVARKGAHPAAMLQLLTAALHDVRQYYQGDFSIWTNTITGHSRMLVERMTLGKAVPWWSGEGYLAL